MKHSHFVGENVTLKELTENHIDERYLSWFKNTDLLKYYSSSGKRFDRESIIKDIRFGKKNKSHYIYGIFHNKDGLCIGNIKIGPIIKKQKTSDLVTIIGDINYHGKQLSVEAIKLANQIAFQTHGLRKLYSGMYTQNISSIKTYLKAGWYIEGTRHGQYWLDGKNVDRILVACFNPKYFSSNEIEKKFKKNNEAYL